MCFANWGQKAPFGRMFFGASGPIQISRLDLKVLCS